MLTKAMSHEHYRGCTSVVLLCLWFVVPCGVIAQSNLVPNHSFELVDSCLERNMGYSLNTGPLDWFSASGSGDLFLTCLPDMAYNNAPQSLWAFQYPQDGDNYVGVITYDEANEAREYFMVELLTPLVVGQAYYASFYANPTWGGSQPQLWLASSHVGMRFTMQPHLWQSGTPSLPPSGQAQLYHPTVISDTVGWTLVSGSFVADSAYQYLMIGNHFSNATTDTLHFADLPWNPRGHTLIDNVCVSSGAGGCPMANGVQELGSDLTVLYPNPSTGQVMIDNAPGGTKARVYTTLGQLVWEGRSPSGSFIIHANNWARGVYHISLSYADQYRSMKFVLTE